MANMHLLTPRWSDAGTYSGGSWSPSLPLDNLKTQQPQQVARSTNATTANTKFKVDLGLVRPVSMFALINTNNTDTATVRFRVSMNSDGSSPGLDSTIPAVPPSIVFGSLPWGGFPWTGIEDFSVTPGGRVTYYKHPEAVFGRYVFVDISDTSNPDGYVQLGRFMAGDAFVPQVNIDWGAQLSFVDESKQSRSVGMQLYSDKKPLRRKLQCSFGALSESEAMGVIYDLHRTLGKTGNCIVVYDPDDNASMVLRRTIYGTLPELPAISHQRSSEGYQYGGGLTIEELI
ncbi:MAG: hypothetical protein M9932_04130 [Xanthobacteraceae bacterium]|nr:hypothetical protein [Xanthobacteraceae bacterium]